MFEVGDFKRETLFFQNTECEFYPCISGIDPKDFNCKFCYCPLYYLPIDCEGTYTLGIGESLPSLKDCSNCKIPHNGEDGLKHVLRKIEEFNKICKNNKY